MEKGIQIKARDIDEAASVYAEIREMIVKDPEHAGDIPITMDLYDDQGGKLVRKFYQLPDDAAVSPDALAPLVARYGDRVTSVDVGRVRKQTLQRIFLIVEHETDLEGLQETFERNKDLFDGDADQSEKVVTVFVYSVATDQAVAFYPDCRFTEKHVPLLKKLFGEGRVYEYTSPAEYVFNWTGSTVPKEVREYGREGFNKDWFEVPEDERSEAENSLIAERLQNYFSLLGDDMSKVKHIKNLTSDEVSVTDAALVMIWKELHELNAKMN